MDIDCRNDRRGNQALAVAGDITLLPGPKLLRVASLLWRMMLIAS